MLKVKCKHCGHINEIDYAIMRADLLGNHFHKFRCSNAQCNKRNLVRYQVEILAVEDTKGLETTEQIVEKKTIE